MKLIVGNWKANKTLEETKVWWSVFSKTSFPVKACEVVICPPAVYLYQLYEMLQTSRFPFPVKLGVQNLSEFPGGTYTGEITGRMIKNIATYAIIGHSERRRWFGETAQSVARRVVQALDNGITPIISIDRQNYVQQLDQFDKNMLPKLMFMYEPQEAISREIGPIGEGTPASFSDVSHMVTLLQKLSPKSKILYGGSVKSHNVSEFLSLPGIDGVVPGTASMNVLEFIKLIIKS